MNEPPGEINDYHILGVQHYERALALFLQIESVSPETFFYI